MKKYDGKIVGILGTLIIHLIAAILFMSFQLRTLHKNMADKYQIEFTPVDEAEIKAKPVESTVPTVEKVLRGDEEMLNIARNLANKSDQKVSPSEIIDKVKEELIKSGKLGVDNYIDEQKHKPDPKTDETLPADKENMKKDDKEKPKDSQKMAANFKGPTRIYYDLAGRTHTFLPLPIYKCQGDGKVVMEITVNQQGIVEKAIVLTGESSASDPCLYETAVNTALISRFNSDISSPKIETGTLTYQFVAQ